MIRPLYALFLILAVASCAVSAPVRGGYGGWEWQYPLPQGQSLNDVCFVSDEEGWAVGQFGAIIHTTDGGASWEGQQSNTVQNLHDAFFSDRLHGWIIGTTPSTNDLATPVALRTEDGGQSWWPMHTFTSEPLGRVFFLDTLEGWVVGNAGMAARTLDGGKTWRRIELSTTASLNTVFFVNSKCGWIGGSNSLMMRTVDGGKTWTASYSVPGPACTDLYFLNESTGWAAMSDGGVRRTKDGGITWESAALAPGTAPTSIQFFDKLHGIASGSTVWTTSDGGVTWARVTPDESSIWGGRAQWASPQVGWRPSGVRLFRTDDGGLSWRLLTGPDHGAYQMGGVWFTDRLNGWAINHYPPIILHTSDGGKTWAEQYVKDDGTFTWQNGWTTDVHFSDSLNGWVVGQVGGMALRTTDGGKTWERAGLPDLSGTSMYVWATDPQTCWIDGFVTRDGGKTWTPTNNGGGPYCFVNPREGWRGSGGALESTVDGGFTWTPASPTGIVDPYYGGPGWVMGLSFADMRNGAAIVGSGLHAPTLAVVVTHDGGATWTKCPVPFSEGEEIHGISFPDADRGYVCSHSGQVWYTWDGGRHWRSLSPGTGQALFDVQFVDDDYGWVVGRAPGIFHTSTGGFPPGDLDRDRFVLPDDSRLALNLVSGFESANASQMASADVDGDGWITLADAASIQREAARTSFVEGLLTRTNAVSGSASHFIRPASGPAVGLVSATVALFQFEGQSVRLRGQFVPGYPASGSSNSLFNVHRVE